MKIVLDTSLLIKLFEDRFDVFGKSERACGEPCEFFATKSTMAELSSIAAGTKAKSRAAKAALLLEGEKFSVLPSQGKADDALLALDAQEYAVATFDRKLAAQLREEGFRVLTEYKNNLLLS